MILNLPFYLDWFFILIVIYAIGGYIFRNTKVRGPLRNYEGVELSGKVAIITGSSAGVGKISAKVLAQHKCTIVFACRNKSKTEPIIKEIV